MNMHEYTAKRIAFEKADDVWQLELIVQFGWAAAAKVRYLPDGRGEEGTRLRALWETRDAALRDWQQARRPDA